MLSVPDILDNYSSEQIGQSDNLITVKRADEKMVDKSLVEKNWDIFFNETNPDVAVDLVINTVGEAVNNVTTVNSYVVTNRTQKLKPWITSGLVKSVNVRDKLLKVSNRHPNSIVLRERFKKYRNMLDKLIKKTKEDYYKRQFADADNPKDSWRIVNEFFVGKSNSKVKIQDRFRD